MLKKYLCQQGQKLGVIHETKSSITRVYTIVISNEKERKKIQIQIYLQFFNQKKKILFLYRFNKYLEQMNHLGPVKKKKKIEIKCFFWINFLVLRSENLSQLRQFVRFEEEKKRFFILGYGVLFRVTIPKRSLTFRHAFTRVIFPFSQEEEVVERKKGKWRKSPCSRSGKNYLDASFF